MAEKVEHIGRKDIVWSYASTIFMVGAGVILIPFILHMMPEETVGLWNIFQTITALMMLLDFGFRPTFARNVSYIFSGVKILQKEGVAYAESDSAVDYGLLKGSLSAMKRFYRWMALSVFIILLTGGTAYFHLILQKYSGDRSDAMIAWLLLIAINCFNLYTLYYDSLLTGKVYIKRSQQINILGQAVYIGLAIILIYCGFGLIAIVSAQLISTIIRRILMYKVFFTKGLKDKLSTAEVKDPKDVLKAITPNAVKIGLTNIGGFLVTKSALLIGSACLSLEDVASYGITLQVMDVLARCAAVFFQSYTPKLAQYRAVGNLKQLRHYYVTCTGSLWLIYLIGGIAWLWLGDWALSIIDSQTGFVQPKMLCVMLLISALEYNHIVSAGFIMADNKIPFFIPSLLSGAATVILLVVFLWRMDMGLWGMILAPGIAQLAYQNWKWPSVVIKELYGGSPQKGDLP